MKILTKDNMKDINEGDIEFFSFCDSGGMGDPGNLEIVTKDKQAFEFNCIDDELDLDMFFSHFKQLEKVLNGDVLWEEDIEKTSYKWINLGMGNSLFVKVSIYDKFVQALIKEIIDFCSKTNDSFCPNISVLKNIKSIDELDPILLYKNWFKVANEILEVENN